MLELLYHKLTPLLQLLQMVAFFKKYLRLLYIERKMSEDIVLARVLQ